MSTYQRHFCSRTNFQPSLVPRMIRCRASTNSRVVFPTSTGSIRQFFRKMRNSFSFLRQWRQRRTVSLILSGNNNNQLRILQPPLVRVKYLVNNICRDRSVVVSVLCAGQLNYVRNASGSFIISLLRLSLSTSTGLRPQNMRACAIQMNRYSAMRSVWCLGVAGDFVTISGSRMKKGDFKLAPGRTHRFKILTNTLPVATSGHQSHLISFQFANHY